MTRRFLGALGALCLCFALVATGCGDEDSEDSGGGGGDGGGETVTMGMVLPGFDNPFWRSVRDGAEAEAKKTSGVELEVTAPSQQSQVDEAISLVEEMVVKGVDVLAVAPSVADQIRPSLDRAVADGIKVLIVDTPIPDWGKEETFIGTDNTKAAADGMNAMIDEMGGSGDVGMLVWPGQPVVEERVNAAKDAAESAGVEVVQEVPMDCAQEGLSATEDVLQKHPDVKGVFVPCGTAAVNAARAIDLDGKLGKIVVYGYDGTKAELEAIKDGKLNATVSQRPAEMGATAVREGLRVGRGETIKKRYPTGYDIVTKDNVDEFLSKAQ